MKKDIFDCFEQYMQECMKDSAHDSEHIYRVLYLALDIAEYEVNVDKDVLIIACLLHDIGREMQYKNPSICHAQVGAEIAYAFCVKNGLDVKKSLHIKECISSHRYRGDNQPQSMEAKILFDADKLDVTGTIGIARTLLYKGNVGEPLYNIDESGNVLDGTQDTNPSFLQEYNCKLKHLYSNFNTKRAQEIAAQREKIAISFYESMMLELSSTYDKGHLLVDNIILGG